MHNFAAQAASMIDDNVVNFLVEARKKLPGCIVNYTRSAITVIQSNKEFIDLTPLYRMADDYGLTHEISITWTLIEVADEYN